MIKIITCTATVESPNTNLRVVIDTDSSLVIGDVFVYNEFTKYAILSEHGANRLTIQYKYNDLHCRVKVLMILK